MSDRLEFEHLVIDSAQRRVIRREETIELPGLSFDLLLFLARRAPEPATNSELASEVWQQAVVSDQTIAQRIAIVRRALGDDASDPQFVRTVRGKGYAFIASPSDSQTNPATPPSRRRFVVTVAAVLLPLAVLGGLAALAINENRQKAAPVLVDPDTGAVRLDNPGRPLVPPASAQVDGRSVFVAGLPEWSMVRGHPTVVQVVCSLMADPAQFQTAIAPKLEAYLDDPGKEADCKKIGNRTVAPG